QLLSALQTAPTSTRLLWTERRGRLEAMHARAREEAAPKLKQLAEQRPIAPEWIGAELSDHLPERAIVLDELVTNVESARRHLRVTAPGGLLTAGAPGLGWALGAAIGTRLAMPDHTPLALVGDGTFIFGSPVAALWMARE